MQQRIRWYSIAPFKRRDLEAINKCLIRDEFNQNRNWGFRIETFLPTQLEATFIEQKNVIEKVTDPFGKTLEFSRVEYRSLSFRLATTTPNLELYDAPTSIITTFLNQLSAYLEFEVSISSPQVDILDWLKRIDSKIANLEVIALSLTDISLSSTVKAQAMLAGTQDVRAFVTKISGNRKCRIHKATFEGKMLEHQIKCEICSEGRANIVKGSDSSLLDLLRDTLFEATQNSY